MGLRSSLAAVISLLWLSVLAVPGCAWETNTNHDDDGDSGVGDARDAGGTDQGPVYPPGPYGIWVGDTVRNFKQMKCLCPGGAGKDIYMEEFLGAKAILITVHSGTCIHCAAQAAGMQQDFWMAYKNQGLEIMLILIGDDAGSAEEEALLDYCCVYKDLYSMTFTMAIDPDVDVMSDYIDKGTPLNMLLDDEMEIRYKMEANIPETLEGNIQALLKE